MAEYRYHWEITTLTPLHVGSGERLREGYDFIQQGSYLWMVNHGGLFRAVLEEALRQRRGNEAQIAADIAGMTLYQIMDNSWLRLEHFDLQRGIFSYRLPGRTSKKGRDGEIYIHIKDIEHRPYLPGSSLKGALRSAVLRAVTAKDSKKPQYQHGNPKTAASIMEQRYFAAPNSDWKKFPNFDLWRALHITDSTPLPTEKLSLAQAIVYRRPARAQNVNQAETIPLDLEVIPAGVKIQASSWVDTWLFNDSRAADELGFESTQKEWLTTALRQIVNDETAIRLKEEQDFYLAISAQGGALPAGIGYSINDLFEAYNHLAEDEFMLPVGKGTGWRSKTLGRVLQEKLTDEEFAQLVNEFKLGKRKWRRSESIPYTRLLASVGKQRNAPLGWVKIRIIPEKRE